MVTELTQCSAANLTGLVGVATAIAATPEGQALLAELGRGNKTVFAPNNEAFVSNSSARRGGNVADHTLLD